MTLKINPKEIPLKPPKPEIDPNINIPIPPKPVEKPIKIIPIEKPEKPIPPEIIPEKD